MADNYLITGYWGEPHVTAENDRGINAAIFGTGRFVLPVGEQFRAEYIGNNTIRMYDGKLLDNGAAAGIPAGRYVDLLIHEAGLGMNRNDLIVFQYKKDGSTLIESGSFIVVSGTETAGDAEDPILTQNNLLSDEATFDQMALWRVPVSSAVISDPVRMFAVSKNMKSAGNDVVAATSTDGVAYTAFSDGVEELYPGLTITIIPNKESASTTPKLNVNGLGEKYIRRRASNSTATTVPASSADWLGENKPVSVMYDGMFWIADFPRPNAADMYGNINIAREFSSGVLGAATSYTTPGSLSKLYVVTLLYTDSEQISPSFSVVMEWKTISDLGKQFGGSAVFYADFANRVYVEAKINADNTVTFATYPGDDGVQRVFIQSVVGLY